MGGDDNNPARLRLAMILGGLLAIAGILWFSGALVQSPPLPGKSPPLAQQPSPDTRPAEEAARKEAERVAAERQTAERREAEGKAEAARHEAEQKAQAAERERQAAEALRRETEARRLAAEQAQAAWNAVSKSDVRALEDYLQRYPDSANAAAARAALQSARQAADKAAAEAKRAAEAERDWPAAQAGGAAALEAYLDRYPDGPRTAEAQAALDGLNSRAASRANRGERDRLYYKPRRYNPFADHEAEQQPKTGGIGGIARAPASSPSERPAGPPITIASVPQKPAPPSEQLRRRAAEGGSPPTRFELEKMYAGETEAGRNRLTRSLAPTPPKTATAPPPPPQKAAGEAGTLPPPSPSGAPSMPLFPKEPPRASARYEIPDAAFANMKTYGDATKFILAALESGGYVERSYFSTEAGGVAMVTRLERINDDGTPAPAASRWALKAPPDGAIAETISFLRGLFFVEKGRYRTIVFMLQDQPFTQSDKAASEKDVRDWIPKGANLLSSDAARKPYAGAHCTALIYEFASDGSAVKLVDSRLTGKEHLARSGLLSALEQAR